MSTPRSPRRKPTPTMAALIESKKGPNTLLADIQQHVVKRSLEASDRRQDIIHPSEMAKEDWCPRQTTYRLRGVSPTEPERVHGNRMLAIFQEGHDIHSKYQTWLMEMGRLWGRYECPICRASEWGLGPMPCVQCHGLMAYKEVPLDGEADWMIAGHADGAIPDLEAFIEIKSVGLGTLRMEEPHLVRQYTVKTAQGGSVVDYDALFKAIKRPLKSHRKQAAIYLAIAQHLGWNYNKMVFIYENKANQETKPFVVPFDADLANGLIETAKDIKWAVEQGTDLPRPVGFTRDTRPCKDCPFQSHCWADKDAPREQDRTQEPDDADGDRVPRSQAQARPAEDPGSDQAGRRVPRTARGSHRTVRQRADAAVRPADEVGGVPQRATGGGGGRRTVRRRITGTGAGDQGL